VTRLRLYYVRLRSLVIAALCAAIVASLAAGFLERATHFPYRVGFLFAFFPCTYFLFRLIYASPLPAAPARGEMTAINDFAEYLAGMPLDIARRSVAGVLANPDLRNHRQDPEDESPVYQTDILPIHLRELFDRDPLIHLDWVCRVGARLIRQSRYVPGFLRIGTAGPTETSELAFRPGEETIYELDPHSTAAGPFNPRNTFPSFYHWLLFQCRTFTCPNCQYNLLADPVNCPECGHLNPNIDHSVIEA
jgi:hypothetical protein